MVRLFSKYLSTYGYESISDFLLSVAPSFKYGLQVPAISLSAVAAFVTQWLGLSPFLAVAMLVAIATEMRTGIRASRRQGIPFESFRFSRCIIKLGIWLAIIYIVHAFYKECLLQEAVHMHAAARRGDDVHEALQHRVVAVRPTHRDIDIAGSHDLLRMQVAVRVHCLRLLMVRALPAYSPHGGNGLAVGEEVHEIDNATGMAEFLHTPVSRH